MIDAQTKMQHQLSTFAFVQLHQENNRRLAQSLKFFRVLGGFSMALEKEDVEMYMLCEDEKERQRNCIELIASENFVSQAVLSALSSAFHNKYSEGTVGARLVH